MDDLYEALRSQAQQKRDAIIEAARIDYQRAVEQINALRCHIAGTRHNRTRATPRRVSDLIREYHPQDRPFLISEMAEILAAVHPGRNFHVPTVRTFCQRLVTSGVLRRVERKGNNVLYAAAAYSGSESKFGAKTLVDMAQEALGNYGPMNERELLARIRETGYRA